MVRFFLDHGLSTPHQLSRPLIAIEAPQSPLRFLELLFCLLNRAPAVRQALIIVRLFFRPRLVFMRAEVLDLLARIFDFRQPQCR